MVSQRKLWIPGYRIVATSSGNRNSGATGRIESNFNRNCLKPLCDSRRGECAAVQDTVNGNGFAGFEVFEPDGFTAVCKNGVLCRRNRVLLEIVRRIRARL